jgi:hypothetical protein
LSQIEEKLSVQEFGFGSNYLNWMCNFSTEEKMDQVSDGKLLSLRFTPDGSTICPLCSLAFSRPVDCRDHIAKEHYGDPATDCYRVAYCLSDALTGVLLAGPCLVCPPGHRAIVSDEGFLEHLRLSHNAEANRLVEICPELKKNSPS